MRLPRYAPTRYTLYVLIALIVIVVVDFAHAFTSGGFMSPVGLVALVACGPTMFVLAHFIGNHDLQPQYKQRNRDRFIKK